MMGIPIDGVTHIYGVSTSEVNKTSQPESVLNKNNNAVCYHTVHKSVAIGDPLLHT